MRRMIDDSKLVSKPTLYFEDELINNSEVQVSLGIGRYLIELHQSRTTCVAFLCVSEEGIAISTATQFNSGIAGAAAGCYHYDKMGEVLELIDDSENIITVSGHIDIYRF